jgi:hypothetical protein
MLHIFLYGDDWVQHLACIVNQRPDLGIVADYCEYPEVRPWRILAKVLRADVLMRVGVRPGAKGKRLYLLDCMWWIFQRLFRSKRTIYYWIGTDVLDAAKERQLGKRGRFGDALRRGRHFANAPWLAEELRGIGVDSEQVLFPVGKVSPPEQSHIEWPSEFTVVAYIPDGRSEFYGGEAFAAVAWRMPHARFLVVGGNGSWLMETPPNLKFLGYVQDMGSVLNQAHVVVRQVEHDAIGGTVREGLFYARHVIYSYPLVHTAYARWGDQTDLHRILSEWQQQFQQGELHPNWAGRAYAMEAWDPERLLRTFTVALQAVEGEG